MRAYQRLVENKTTLRDVCGLTTRRGCSTNAWLVNKAVLGSAAFWLCEIEARQDPAAQCPSRAKMQVPELRWGRTGWRQS
jgi:hypothetical protein